MKRGLWTAAAIVVAAGFLFWTQVRVGAPSKPQLAASSQRRTTASKPVGPSLAQAQRLVMNKKDSILLSPSAARPGAEVTVVGYFPNVKQPPAAQGPDQANLCFGGCDHGLPYSGVQVHWSARHRGLFTMRFPVPQAPWVSYDGNHPLVAGHTYRVGLQCLDPQQPGCATEPALTSALFKLLGPVTHRCRHGACGDMHLTPAQASPGTKVSISGWAPLTQIIGQPFGYTLTLHGPGAQNLQIGNVAQNRLGQLSGSFVMPLTAYPRSGQKQWIETAALTTYFNGQCLKLQSTPASARKALANRCSHLVAPTRLIALAPPTWASLGRLKPLQIQSTSALNGPQLTLSTDRKTLTYCLTGAIVRSNDLGVSWSSIPTQAAISTVLKSADPIFGSSCTSATINPAYPRSVFAAFGAADRRFGAPPIYTIGMYTLDNGLHWSPAPVPKGLKAIDFGNFLVDGPRVLALYRSGQGSDTFQVESTSDGGATWHRGTLSCPSTGPCLRWGAAPAEDLGMGIGAFQPIERSLDHGKHWQSPAWPSQVALNMGPSQLVALSAKAILLVSGTESFPLRWSTDGGRRWRAVALPPLPANDGYQPYVDLQLLPNGSLLTESASGPTSFSLLSPGSHRWCSVPSSVLPQEAAWHGAPLVVASRLDWLASPSPNGPYSVHSVALTHVTCAG